MNKCELVVVFMDNTTDIFTINDYFENCLSIKLQDPTPLQFSNVIKDKIISDFSLNSENNIITIKFYNTYYELQFIACGEYPSTSIFDINPNSQPRNKTIQRINSNTIFFNDDTKYLFKIHNNGDIGDGYIDPKIVDTDKKNRFQTSFHKVYLLSDNLLPELINTINLMSYLLL